MHNYQNLTDVQLKQPSIVAIGVFDGVHRGHQHLIRQLVVEAHARGSLAVVVTFFPHPDRVLHDLTGRYYLTSPEQKARFLEALGVDVLVTHPFNDETRQVRAATFVDQLLAHLHMVGLRTTAGFALGYRREGDFAFLSAQGQDKGFEVREVSLVLRKEGEQQISSSSIRQALLDGDVRRAAFWLGRMYGVEGTVVHGDHRGRTIGFPTANLDIWQEQILPANGVYACRARLGNGIFESVTNVGLRPTFGGDLDLRVEAHLLDFDRDIYGEKVAIDFVARLRDEQKFSGLDALVTQIHQDVERGRQMLASPNDASSPYTPTL